MLIEAHGGEVDAHSGVVGSVANGGGVEAVFGFPVGDAGEGSCTEGKDDDGGGEGYESLTGVAGDIHKGYCREKAGADGGAVPEAFGVENG